MGTGDFQKSPVPIPRVSIVIPQMWMIPVNYMWKMCGNPDTHQKGTGDFWKSPVPF